MSQPSSRGGTIVVFTQAEDAPDREQQLRSPRWGSIVATSALGVGIWVWESLELFGSIGAVYGFSALDLLPLLLVVLTVEVGGALLLAVCASLVASRASLERALVTGVNLGPILSGGLGLGTGWLRWVGLLASLAAIALVWIDRFHR